VNTFALVAVLMAIVAFAGWLNVKFLRLPHSVAMLFAGSGGALLLLAAGIVFPSFISISTITAIIDSIDFTSTVTGYMLAFLLFAGAMQVDLKEMLRHWFSVSALSTLGVAGSILVVGFGLWAVAAQIGVPLPLTWSLVFGALIAPTDPVAVLATVHRVRLSKTLQVVLEGEALFNDGVGIVAFTALLAVATGSGALSPANAVSDVVVHAVGGLVLGLGASALVVRVMGTIDDFAVEVTLSIALAMGVYAAAEALHLSGAIAAVGAGLLFGGERAKRAMRGVAENYVRGFWRLVDQILNALLFLLLGVEMIVVSFTADEAPMLVAAVLLVLFARLAVVVPWGIYFRARESERGATEILCWGGLHGALSLALALSIPQGPERALILSLTYAVVAFSVIVQGLTFTSLARHVQTLRATASAKAAQPDGSNLRLSK